MDNETAVAIPHEFGLSVSRDPKAVIAEAKRAADALKSILEAKPRDSWVMMNGERYLEYEDWATIAKFYGVTAKIVSTTPVEFGGVHGWEATAAAFHGPTGQEVSRADSMCLNDEDKWSSRSKYEWKDGRKQKVGDVPVPSFQLRSMAQTRACAKVLKNVFSWVVVLAGFRPQVAEEMTGDEENKPKADDEENKPKAEKIADPRPKAEPQAASETAKTETPKEGEQKITFLPAASSTKPDKNGKARWAVKSPEGLWFGTYDLTAGEIAVGARESKVPVTLTYTQDGEFRTIVSAKI